MSKFENVKMMCGIKERELGVMAIASSLEFGIF